MPLVSRRFHFKYAPNPVSSDQVISDAHSTISKNRFSLSKRERETEREKREELIADGPTGDFRKRKVDN